MGEDTGMFEIPEIWKRVLSRLMQAIIFGVLVIGLYEFSVAIIVNALFSLAVSFTPALLEWDYKTPAFMGITFWITVAVLMHAVGVLGPYDHIWWWDSFLHAFGSFLVASVGYAFVKAIKEHSKEVALPSNFMSIFIILFTMAIGVIWEIIEYAATILALQVGVEPIVTPDVLNDTLLDLILDFLGGLIFAIWGVFYFTDYSDRLKKVFEEWRGKKS